MLTFLDLPFEARVDIYTFSGLVRPCPIDLTFRREPTPPPHQVDRVEDNCYYELTQRGSMIYSTYRYKCVCPELPTALLLISTAVRKEARTVLFGRNKFVYRRHAGSDLSFFWSLSAFGLAAMTSLFIRLNCWPCRRGHDAINDPISTCSFCSASIAQGDPVLCQGDRHGQNLIKQWRALCIRLGSLVSPGRLKLTLVCDVGNLDTGKAVVEPLAYLPVLRECTLRLGRQPNNDLRALARQTSQSLTRAVPEAGFPFDSLPEELRVRILSFSHLGSLGSYHGGYKLLRIEDNRLAKGNREPVPRPICCSGCTETFADCCCPTAYASYSASCECRLFPLELFLVSKTMYRDTLRTMYSENCFDFVQNPEITVSFLSRLPAGALTFIRRIQFRFSQEQVQRWYIDGLRDHWNRLVAFVQRNLHLSNLLIVVNLQAVYDICLWHDSDEDEVRFVYEIYCQITGALCALHGLCDLHFLLGWFTDLEPILERQVMGEAYDSSQGNRYSKVPSSATCAMCLQLPSNASCMKCGVPSWHC